MVEVTCLRDHAELLPLRNEWQELAGGALFADWAWLVNWADNYVSAKDLYVLVARDESSRALAVLPLYRESSLVRGRSLSFLGSGKVCTDYQTVLATKDQAQAEPAIRAMASWLARSSDRDDFEWDLLELESTRPDDKSVNWLADELQKLGLAVQTREAPCCWKLALAPSWDEQMGGLVKDMRRKLRKIVRDYVETGRAQLRICETPDELKTAMDLLVAFHQRRWQEVGVEGCFSRPEFERFLRHAVEELAADGRVWLAQLDVDHRPVAVSLFLRSGASEYALYQCGMNTEARACQPGWLANIMNLQRMIDCGVTHCDYLRGEERYKRELRANPVPLVTYGVAAPHVAGRLRSAVVQTEKWLKDWRRQYLQGSESRTK